MRSDAIRDEVEVTQLSTTLVGRDASEVAATRRTTATPTIQRRALRREPVNAGTVDDQIGRFRALADRGVRHGHRQLSRPRRRTEPIERFAPVIAAFAEG